MGIFNFYKRNKKENSEVINKLDLNKKNVQIVVGQTLYCKNGETVVVREVIENSIIVDYKDLSYERPKNIIGTMLFIDNPTLELNNSIELKQKKIMPNYCDNNSVERETEFEELLEYGTYIENYMSDEEKIYKKEFYYGDNEEINGPKIKLDRPTIRF